MTKNNKLERTYLGAVLNIRIGPYFVCSLTLAAIDGPYFRMVLFFVWSLFSVVYGIHVKRAWVEPKSSSLIFRVGTPIYHILYHSVLYCSPRVVKFVWIQFGGWAVRARLCSEPERSEGERSEAEDRSQTGFRQVWRRDQTGGLIASCISLMFPPSSWLRHWWLWMVLIDPRGSNRWFNE